MVLATAGPDMSLIGLRAISLHPCPQRFATDGAWLLAGEPTAAVDSCDNFELLQHSREVPVRSLSDLERRGVRRVGGGFGGAR